MPIGLVLIHWDVKIGPGLFHSIPEDLEVTNSLLTQIYSSHRYNSLKAGFSSISFQDKRIVSYFSGLEGEIVGSPNYVVALILRKDEKASKYRKPVIDAAMEILPGIEGKKHEKLMKKAFDEIKKL